MFISDPMLRVGLFNDPGAGDAGMGSVPTGGGGGAEPTPSQGSEGLGAPPVDGSQVPPEDGQEYIEFVYNKEPVKVPKEMQTELLQQGYYYANKGKAMLNQLKQQVERLAPLQQLEERLNQDPNLLAYMQEQMRAYHERKGQQGQAPVQNLQTVRDPRIDEVVSYIQQQKQEALRQEIAGEYSRVKDSVMKQYGIEYPQEMLVRVAAEGNYPSLRAAYLDMIADKIPDQVIKSYTQSASRQAANTPNVPPIQGSGIPATPQQNQNLDRSFSAIRQRVMQRLGS
jgi:ABC-type glycerol-3-phosphate transport system substrate-binding protein